MCLLVILLNIYRCIGDILPLSTRLFTTAPMTLLQNSTVTHPRVIIISTKSSILDFYLAAFNVRHLLNMQFLKCAMFSCSTCD